MPQIAALLDLLLYDRVLAAPVLPCRNLAGYAVLVFHEDTASIRQSPSALATTRGRFPHVRPNLGALFDLGLAMLMARMLCLDGVHVSTCRA